MKTLLVLLLSFLAVDASAQWYAKLPFVKKHERYAALNPAKMAPYQTVQSGASFNNFKTTLGRSSYSINTEEHFIMGNLRHSKHYGYDSVVLQYNNLAAFYANQNRFSEAKWYMLQSKYIAGNHRDYPALVYCLIVLADIKSSLGDFKQADDDLLEAKNIAATHSLTPNLMLIEAHIKQIHVAKESGLKTENRYSDLL